MFGGPLAIKETVMKKTRFILAITELTLYKDTLYIICVNQCLFNYINVINLFIKLTSRKITIRKHAFS